MFEENERFSANYSTLKKSQCALCEHVNGWICKKTGKKRASAYITNEKKCSDFQREKKDAK